MAKKLKWGMIGGGGSSLIGVLHRVASSMYDQYELVGGSFQTNPEKNRAFGNSLGLAEDRIYDNFDAFITGETARPNQERIEVVSVLTPNYLHYEMAKTLLKHEFHVICEKPLTTTFEQAQELSELFANKESIFAVTYTYTGYPMVRQMKQMIADGEIGDIQKVDIQYYQGWINPVIHDATARANTWRLNPEQSGASCCVGDVGTHGFDMLEYVTGMQVKQVLADLNYLYDDNPLDIDGTVLLRFGNKVKGVLRASQIATGEENNFTVSIYGKTGGLKWEQENPNYLYLRRDGKPMVTLKPGNLYLSDIAQEGAKLPAGHPEGIFDSMGNIYKGVARAINGETHHEMEFPTLHDGVRGMQFINRVVSSHKEGNVWKTM